MSGGVLAQFETLDLAGRGFWQIRYKLDPARVFVRRQLLFDV